MALEFNQLLTLAKNVAKATPSAPVAYSFNGKNYSYGDMEKSLQKELHDLAPDYRTYKFNQNTIFALMEQTIDEVFPQRVMESYSQFADIKTFAQGEKPIFVQKITTASRRRAKSFIGKVGLAGLYEVFKLDGRNYEIATNAFGGAAQIGFEEFLDGRVDFSEVLNIVMEGLDECIYVEIEKQLYGAAQSLKAATAAGTSNNFKSGNGFSEQVMDELIAIADSYGHSTIYCTFEFASKMIPSSGRMSNEQMNTLWNNGYLGNYKSHQVIVLPQSYEDETNKVKVVDPSYAYIIPTGAEKPVKIAFEGGTIVDEYTGYDRSREIQVYKKVGVRAVFSNAICVYQDTTLKRSNG